MSLWGHGILRDEGIGGPIESAGGGFMMRNFLVEALMLLAESAGLEVDEPTFESTPVLTDVRRERTGYVVEPGTIGGHDRRVTANVRGGGRLVSVWRGRFDLQPERDGMEGSARVVVDGDPAFETIVRGDLFLDTYPPTGARAMAAVRPLRLLPPGLHTIDELGLRPVYRCTAPARRRRRSRAASASTNAARIERGLRRMDAHGPALRHEVGGDRGDGPGDGRGRRAPDLLDGEVVRRASPARPSRRPSTRTCLTLALRSVRADAAPADVGRREPVGARRRRRRR